MRRNATLVLAVMLAVAALVAVLWWRPWDGGLPGGGGLQAESLAGVDPLGSTGDATREDASSQGTTGAPGTANDATTATAAGPSGSRPLVSPAGTGAEGEVPPGHGRLRIKVVDEAGAPISGAVVRWGRNPDDPWHEEDGNALEDETAAPFVEARTNARGEAVLDGRVAALAGRHAEPLEARAAGYSPRRLDGAEVWHGTTRELGTITLFAARAIGGRVVDEYGIAVKGVAVWAVRTNDHDLAFRSPYFPPAPPANAVRTDGAGRFTLNGVPRGPMLLLAWARGRRPAGVFVPPTRTAAVLLQSKSGVPVTVRVTHEGRPLAGVEVILGDDRSSVSGRSDAEGRLRHPGVRGSVWAQAEDGSRGLEGEHDGAVPEGRDAFEIELALTPVAKPGRSLRGRVVDAATGDPVAAFTLNVETLNEGWQHTKSHRFRDPDGRFAVHQLVGDRYDVWASAPGYRPTRVAGVAMEDRLRAEVEVRLERGGRSVSGVVVDRDGNAIGGVWVSAELDNDHVTGSLTGLLAPVRSGADGRFSISSVPPGSYRVIVDGSHLGWLWTQSEPVTPGGPETRVVLERAARIHGTVTNADGSPAVGAVVWAQKENTLVGTTVGPDGRYLITDAPPGPRDVFVKPERSREPADVRPVNLRAGESVRVDFVRPKPARIAGVASVDGTPAPRAQLLIYQGRNAITFASADDQGRFDSGPLEPGAYTALVNLPGAVSMDLGKLTLEPGRTLERDAAFPAPPVSVTVRLGDAPAPPNVWISFRAGLRAGYGKTGEGGVLQLRGLTAGEWRLYCRMGEVNWDGTAALEGGGPYAVTLARRKER